MSRRIEATCRARESKRSAEILQELQMSADTAITHSRYIGL
jgi:hypothetical protein